MGLFSALRYLFLLCCCCGLLPALHAQNLSFRHLAIEEGMPGNISSYTCFDSTGQLWIATNDGLVSYDGMRIKQYLKETHPGLPSNDIGYLHCDSRNRIWVCTGNGLAMVDEQRRIHRAHINDTLKNSDVDYCIDVAGVGMIAFAGRNVYLQREQTDRWEHLSWLENILQQKIKATPARFRAIDKKTYLFTAGPYILIADFSKQKINLQINLPNVVALHKLNDREILASDADSFKLYRINITNGSILRKYSRVTDTEGKSLTTSIFSSDVAANGWVCISTRTNGLVLFDPVKETFTSLRHQPLNRSSISSDNLRRVYGYPNGYLVITSTTGVNFTNILVPVLRQERFFVDDHQSIIDGVSAVGEDVNGRLWMRSFNKVFTWDRRSSAVKDISPPADWTNDNETTSGLGTICRDADNNMWVAYSGKGLIKYSPSGKLLRFLSKEKKDLPTNRIRFIRLLPDRNLLAGSDEGLFLLNPRTFAADTLAGHPLLTPLRKKRIVNMMTDGEDTWIAVSPNGAAYCYNFKTKKLRTITTADGLSSDRVYCFGKDHLQQMYIGTYEGLNIVSPNGSITIINKQNGLRHPRVENIITDSSGRVWITNFNCLIAYDPVTKTFTYFDEQNGVNNSGFSLGQNLITKDGLLLFCNDGLLMADPAQLSVPNSFKLKVSLNRVYDDGSYDGLSAGEVIHLPYNESKISLFYLTNTLMAANRFFFRYRMEGLDTGWQQPTKNNEVTYTLNPGRYVFHLEAAASGDWSAASTRLIIIVTPAWWQTGWFRLAAILLLALLIYLFFRRRIRSIKARARLQQQMTELEGKALRAQMNPHFIFNSLNAIQELIMTKKMDESYLYLSSFSKLLRQVLNNSEKNLIPLSAELEMLRLQLSLESLRFKNSFTYTFTVDDAVEAELITVPPLLLQPYVENAVWHGLRHKEGEKNLFIRITENKGMLHIVIEDNGVGRTRAGEIKNQKLGAGQFESKGSELSEQRIRLINEQYPGTATVTTEDLKTDNQEPAGTRVIIRLPVNLK